MANKIFEKIYPELAVGGYPRNSHKIRIYNRILSVLKPEHTVLDYGAGRGVRHLTGGSYEIKITNLKGKCRKVIGVDVDPVVVENSSLDEAYVMQSDSKIPLPDNSVDLVMSWAVFEHISNPEEACAELRRVLKPGGWICAFTPNKFGDVAIVARLVPNRLHARVLKSIGMVGDGAVREEVDVFPTFYRLNSSRALKTFFPERDYSHHSYRLLGPPAYNANSLLIAGMMRVYDIITPSFMSRTWHIFIQKKVDVSDPPA